MNTAVRRPNAAMAVIRWFDSWHGIDWHGANVGARLEPLKVDWVRTLPFLLLHLVCLAPIWVGWSPFAVGFALVMFLVRMFAVTAFYHRYFSHRSFKTSRPMQFVLAVAGNTTIQRGPIWWASHHRWHHRVSDQPGDPHSPVQYGLLWSHMGWFMSKTHFAPRLELVKDLVKYPELRFLDRFDSLVPVLSGIGVFALGEALRVFAPGLGTNGLQLLIWGIISSVVLLHSAVTINSLAHVVGRRRYPTTDNSRNSFLLALLTFGEGWHNNHHFYQASVRQGHHWWQIDLSWYLLVVMSWLGLIWDLKPVPEHVLRTPPPPRS